MTSGLLKMNKPAGKPSCTAEIGTGNKQGTRQILGPQGGAVVNHGKINTITVFRMPGYSTDHPCHCGGNSLLTSEGGNDYTEINISDSRFGGKPSSTEYGYGIFIIAGTF